MAVMVWMLGVMILSSILHEGPFVTSIIKRVDKREGRPVLKQKWEALAEWFGQQPKPVRQPEHPPESAELPAGQSAAESQP